MGAGQFRERLTFESPAASDDGMGNTTEGFDEEFTVKARIRPRLGGEQVLQSRLAGHGVYVIEVWSSERTRQIAPDWRATHADGRVFQIKSPARNVDEKNLKLEFDAETGVGG